MAPDVQPGETIRSYHRAFERDRRLHSIPAGGNRQIPLPFFEETGLPVRAFGYAALLVGLAFVLLRMPGISDAMRLAPEIVWYLVLPCVLGVAASMVERDGMALHRWLELEARHRLTPRVRHGGRAVRAEGRSVPVGGRLLVGPDHHGPALRPARLIGPGRVAFSEPMGVLERRRGRSIARPLDALSGSQRKRAAVARAVDLDAGERLEVRP